MKSTTLGPTVKLTGEFEEGAKTKVYSEGEEIGEIHEWYSDTGPEPGCPRGFKGWFVVATTRVTGESRTAANLTYTRKSGKSGKLKAWHLARTALAKFGETDYNHHDYCGQL